MREITYLQAIYEAQREEMKRDRASTSWARTLQWASLAPPKVW